MGDEKQYTIQIKGTAYRFKPLDRAKVEKIGMLTHMHVSGGKLFSFLSKTLAESAGPEQWDALTTRYVNGEIGHQDFTTDLFEKLLKRQGKDKLPDADAE